MNINDKAKSKEEIRRERLLNGSLIPSAKKMQKDLNILAFQKEDYIVKNGERDYVAIFSLKLIEYPSLNFNSLASLLCANLAQRFRISSFYQKVDKKLKDLYFLSIFFHEDAYYIVHDELEKLKNGLFPVLTKYGFQIAPLSLSDIFVFWNLNMNSEMLSLDAKNIFSSQNYTSYFEKPKLKKKEKIIFEYKDNYCVTLKLQSMAPETKGFPFENFKDFHKIFFTSDTWKMTEDDMKVYDRILRSSFYSYKNEKNIELVNFSVSLILMDLDRDRLLRSLDSLYSKCEENGYILSPCFDEEENCFYSLSSFGIIRYLNMHTTELKQAVSFYEEK